MTASDTDSSSSLERHDHSPHYTHLVPSIPSYRDEHLNVGNFAPAHIEVDDYRNAHGQDLPEGAQVLSLEEVQDLRRMINELSVKFD